ncbi:unnamed protein product [Wuchereria bancrofti]|uniref:Uncharacterized protein n=1 Tax=Wuchereria bancrofti TaxID=6293 RepID=A0A3P7FV36_WUCBA|nr:unnamed protein product [Wuchereria bancrofti]
MPEERVTREMSLSFDGRITTISILNCIESQRRELRVAFVKRSGYRRDESAAAEGCTRKPDSRIIVKPAEFWGGTCPKRWMDKNL